MLDQLDALFELMLEHFPGTYFIHNLVYKGTQRYGTEYFTNLKEFMARVPFPLGDVATTEQDSTIETSAAFASKDAVEDCPPLQEWFAAQGWSHSPSSVRYGRNMADGRSGLLNAHRHRQDLRGVGAVW